LLTPWRQPTLSPSRDSGQDETFDEYTLPTTVDQETVSSTTSTSMAPIAPKDKVIFKMFSSIFKVFDFFADPLAYIKPAFQRFFQ